MFKTFDPTQTSELLLLRHGWLNPEFELTGGTDSYGTLSYNGITRRTAFAESANNRWVFRFKELFSRTILICDQNGVVIGEVTREWFSRRRKLALRTGFRAEFYRPFIFSWNYIWESEGYGQIMEIKRYPLNLKDVITIKQTMTPPALIPLLIFLGAHLTILRRRRRAAR
ncbi:MAG: hypothetical protein M3N14_09620 [Bacteroidota bacterium]|nr:hypothetical protein [Bacteroidota bacterium]